MKHIKLGFSHRFDNGDIVSPSIEKDLPDTADDTSELGLLRATLEGFLFSKDTPSQPGGVVPPAHERITTPVISDVVSFWEKEVASRATLPELTSLFKGQYRNVANGYPQEVREAIRQKFSLRRVYLETKGGG